MLEPDKLLGGRRLVLVSNREPYEHVEDARGVQVRRPPGGLVSALDPTMRRTHGVWVAWGSGSADRAASDAHGRVMVPPEDPAYTLRRVWLSREDVDGYYQGFANSALWPLCHMLMQHFQPRSEAWERYREVNERFARAVLEETRGTRSSVWVQDYHLGLVARMLRQEDPSLFIHQFWHIPFPPPDIFRLMPIGMHIALLRGMLGNDMLEFHTDRYARNFLACVSELVPDTEVDVERGIAWVNGREVRVGAFPISIDVERYEQLAASPEAEALARTLRDRYARDGRQLAVSVDRVDYTKGIPERLRALDELWTRRPELKERVTWIIVATPSRSDLEAYASLEREVAETVRCINERHAVEGWTPIVLIPENVSADRLAAIYRAADLCMVSSLQDGMNLVAKEFIACQQEERGVLLLSRFTGAAEEMEGALFINPFNVDGLVDGIAAALDMPLDERAHRMRTLRNDLRRSTIFDWLRAILSRTSAMQGAREEQQVRRPRVRQRDSGEQARR
jgi:alpha,alpha-trehalose-phosphate synthase [UDP-forming]